MPGRDIGIGSASFFIAVDPVFAKAGQPVSKLHFIRVIEFKRIEVDERIEVDDARALVVLDKMVKQRRDSAQQFADALLQKGIYVIGFFYPVVAKGQARIRVQLSAAHDQHHLDRAIAAFTEVGKELGVLKTV